MQKLLKFIKLTRMIEICLNDRKYKRNCKMVKILELKFYIYHKVILSILASH